MFSTNVFNQRFQPIFSSNFFKHIPQPPCQLVTPRVSPSQQTKIGRATDTPTNHLQEINHRTGEGRRVGLMLGSQTQLKKTRSLRPSFLHVRVLLLGVLRFQSLASPARADNLSPPQPHPARLPILHQDFLHVRPEPDLSSLPLHSANERVN